jgi:hypothetical protein
MEPGFEILNGSESEQLHARPFGDWSRDGVNDP